MIHYRKEGHSSFACYVCNYIKMVTICYFSSFPLIFIYRLLDVNFIIPFLGNRIASVTVLNLRSHSHSQWWTQWHWNYVSPHFEASVRVVFVQRIAALLGGNIELVALLWREVRKHVEGVSGSWLAKGQDCGRCHFIVPQFQVYPLWPCFVMLGMDPGNMSSWPAGAMLMPVTQGGEGYCKMIASEGTSFLVWDLVVSFHSVWGSSVASSAATRAHLHCTLRLCSPNLAATVTGRLQPHP